MPLLLLLFLLILPVTGVAGTIGDPEMQGGRKPRSVAPADPVKSAALRKELQAAGENLRPVYEKYLPILGSAAILDIIEEMAPACHAQGHDLGRAIFAAERDLSAAITACGDRCTSGCMHGVVAEALGNLPLSELAKRVDTFCNEKTMAESTKPGNCAHALGHALMFSTGRDVGVSLKGCDTFTDKGMRYYCATGIFMELLVTGRRPEELFPGLHEPCDRYPRFAAACYRFKGPEMLDAFKEDFAAFAAACEKAPAGSTAACFHGLGAAAVPALYAAPERLAVICGRGSEDDRKLCIEGSIEKLAEYDQNKATTACRRLTGDLRKVCEDAAKGKMYRLEKGTFRLYYNENAAVFEDDDELEE